MAGTAKYDPKKHPKLLLELMSQGKFDCTFMGKVGVVDDTFYRWRKNYPEFKEAHKLGMKLCEDWWIEHANEYPAPVWQRIMTVKFAYAGERSVKLKGFGRAKTFNEKVEALQKLARKGIITPGEAALLHNMISTAASINEKTEVARDVEELKKALNNESKE